jgi:uncharacterized protein
LRLNLRIVQTKLARRKDPSHDIFHIKRVLFLAKFIGEREGGDLDIVVPAAIFHDVIVYPKNSKKSSRSALESAFFEKKILH